MEVDRRSFLRATAMGTIATAAGCLGGRDRTSESPGETPSGRSGDGTASGCSSIRFQREEPPGGPPTAETFLPLPDCPRPIAEASIDGGAGEAGIPAIDAPTFVPRGKASAELGRDDPVFGVELNGEAKAYPQYVLVWHEIVNDTIGGEPASVTYCPLTGTAQGFLRGETSFAVSGRLVNSNLVLLDRETESWWSQMLATSIRTPHFATTLREFRVVWTTWGHWLETHPDTVVLTEDTGYQRRYGEDPYGSYAPTEGYYADESLLFEPYVEDDDRRLHPKAVVVGARTEEGAVAVEKEAIRREPVLETTLEATTYTVVYDEPLDTARFYRNPRGLTVSATEAGYEVDGTIAEPDALPLDRVVAYDAMWFAWAGFYPETELLGR